MRIHVLNRTHFGRDNYSDKLQYAIRPTIRNHSLLKRDVVINSIANLIDKSHKVSLTNPDKVILVELYQVSVLCYMNPNRLSSISCLASCAAFDARLHDVRATRCDGLRAYTRSSADVCICYFGVGTFTILDVSTTELTLKIIERLWYKCCRKRLGNSQAVQPQ